MQQLLRFVPRKSLSHLFGRLIHRPLPLPIRLPLLRWFGKRYGVEFSEAAGRIEDYPSLGAFFIRELKPGARPIDQGVVSPADGVITEHGAIEEDRLLQVKGRSYTLGKFLGADAEASFKDGYFVTIYLAPGNYHHVHSPVRGAISRQYLIEGDLFPVNLKSVSAVEGLFTINERLVTFIDVDGRDVGVVAVGATNVGAIASAHTSLRGNASFCRRISHGRIVEASNCAGRKVGSGERLATFMLGSTVVLLFPKLAFHPQLNRGPIKYGQRIGELSSLTISERDEDGVKARSR
jgi:phosphatidylserine decarboxylase